MNHFIRTVAATIAMALCGASFASAQTQNRISVPAAQRTLPALVLRIGSAAQNNAASNLATHINYLPLEKAFCAAIPRGSVSGRVGKVMALTDQSIAAHNGFSDAENAPEGTFLALNVATEGLSQVERSPELLLGNFYWMGVTWSMIQPHPPTIFPVGSPLNMTTIRLKEGDTVIFSGSFVPFRSLRACELALDFGNYFSMFRFASIQKVGSGPF